MKSAFLTLTLATSALLAAEPAEPAKPAPALQSAPSTAKVVDLRVESQTNPTAVNTPLPHFSWRIETEERGWLQKSYHILVASTPELLAKDKGDAWDSGQVRTRNSLFIPFGGNPLRSGQQAHWKVRVTDMTTEAHSPWSDPATFTVALSGPAPLPQPLFLADAPRLSSFDSSDPNLNAIFQAAATRLHKISSLRDVGLAMKAAGYHQTLLPRGEIWLDQLDRSINNLGIYPATLPSDGTFGSTQSDSAISCSHTLWTMTGNRAILDRHMPRLDAYVTLRAQIAPQGTECPFGNLPADTLPAGDPTPEQFVHLTSQAINIRLLIEVSTFAIKTPYAKQALMLAQKNLSDQFRVTYLQDNGLLKFESLTADLLALRCGLLSEKEKNAISQHAFDLLTDDSKQAAFSESPFVSSTLLPVLSWTGHADSSLTLAQSLNPEELSPLALASTSEWLISFIAGIGTRSAGWQFISLNPQIPAESSLKFAKAHFDSPHGRISAHWEHKDGAIHYHVTIPSNATAIVTLPSKNPDSITESGKVVASTPQFSAFEHKDQSASFLVSSGVYRFKTSR